MRYAREFSQLQGGLKEAQADDSEENRKPGQGLPGAPHGPGGPGGP